MAETAKMQTRRGPRNQVLDGIQLPRRKGQFGGYMYVPANYPVRSIGRCVALTAKVNTVTKATFERTQQTFSQMKKFCI